MLVLLEYQVGVYNENDVRIAALLFSISSTRTDGKGPQIVKKVLLLQHLKRLIYVLHGDNKIKRPTTLVPFWCI